LRARGFAIAYPRVVADARPLVFHAVADLGELVPGYRGIQEPATTAPALELAAIAAFVIPGAAFDRAGNRLGWGRGHYDATLARAPHALRVGLAFDCQIVDHLAREDHDIPLHLVVTESGTLAPGDRIS
jgi:5-formyltetrahydrofolate cyclo-ligase